MGPGQVPGWIIGVSYLLLAWIYLWKGLALWQAAKHNQRNWFLFILILNPPILTTFGILEIIYLFGFCKKKMTIKDIQNWFKNTFFTKEKIS